MKKANKIQILQIRPVLIMLVLCIVNFNVDANNSRLKINNLINSIYQGISIANTKYELGALHNQTYRHPLTSKLILSFSQETYSKDIKRAYLLLAKLETKQKSIIQNHSKQSKPLTRMQRLMKAEASIAKNTPPPQYFVSDFDLMTAFKETRQSRLDTKNRIADNEIQAVVSERQAAEQQIIHKQEQKAALQAQSSAWQEQLDKQAIEQATALREWKKQNGFGAHVRRIFTGAIGAGLSSFTGGLTSAIGGNLANEAIDKILD